MRSVRRLRVVVVALVGLVAVCTPGVAGAQEGPVVVSPGESIQAAVDSAGAGATIVVRPGTYRENVTITEDDVSLIGVGVTLEEPDAPTPGPCVDPEDPEINGICVLGPLDPDSHEPVGSVHNVSVIGFTVRGFSGIGVVLFGADNTLVQYVDAEDNGSYGITAFASTGTRFLNNRASGSEEAGFYIGDSPDAQATLMGNVAVHNELTGFLLRDASFGHLTENQATGNCVGAIVLDTGETGPAMGWDLQTNGFVANNAACPALEEEGFPATSGTGLLLAGAQHTTVNQNLILDNVPSGDTPFGGGVRLFDTTSLGGSVPQANLVSGNVIIGNQPADIIDDGTGQQNQLLGNLCNTSIPDGLCTLST